eukprot:PhF_6_TR13642/c0_g1_i1/m.21875
MFSISTVIILVSVICCTIVPITRADYVRAVEGLLATPTLTIPYKMKLFHKFILSNASALNSDGDLEALVLPETFTRRIDQDRTVDELFTYALAVFQNTMHAIDHYIEETKSKQVVYEETAVRAVVMAQMRYHSVVRAVLEQGTYKYAEYAFIFWGNAYATLSCTDLRRAGSFDVVGLDHVCNPKQLGDKKTRRVYVAVWRSSELVEPHKREAYVAWERGMREHLPQQQTTFVYFQCTPKPNNTEGGVSAPTNVVGDMCVKNVTSAENSTVEWKTITNLLPAVLNIDESSADNETTTISILKLDFDLMEEYKFVADWLLHHLVGNCKTFKIQQLIITIHSLQGFHYHAMLDVHLLMMHLYALGFVPVHVKVDPRGGKDGGTFRVFTLVNAVWYVEAEQKERVFTY